MGIFDRFKKKDSKYKYIILKDNYKTKEYYIDELTKINSFIDKLNNLYSNNKNNNYEFCIPINNYLLKKIRILYVLGEEFDEIKKLVVEYCDNLSKRSQLVYNEVTNALSLGILYNIGVKSLEFIKEKMISEKNVDATLDLLRNKVFENKVLNTKEFYYKEKGYFGDEYSKDYNGLMKVINADSIETKNKELKKFLKEEKERHYQKILKYYDEIGENRYIYTGSFDFKLTAVAKILDIDKSILENSKFIAIDLL